MKNSMDYSTFMEKCPENLQIFLNDAFGFYHYLAFTKAYSISDDELRLNYSLLLASVLHRDLFKINPYNYKTSNLIFRFFDAYGVKNCQDEYERKTIFNLFLNCFLKYTNQETIDPEQLSMEQIMIKVIKNKNIEKLLKSLEDENNQPTKYETILENFQKNLELFNLESQKIISSLNAAMQQYLYITMSYYKILENRDVEDKEKIALFLAGVNCTSVFSPEEERKIFEHFAISNLMVSISLDYIEKNISKFSQLFDDILIKEEDKYTKDFMNENAIYVALYNLINNPEKYWLEKHLMVIFDPVYYLQLVHRLEKIIKTKINNFSQNEKEEEEKKPKEILKSNKLQIKGKNLQKYGIWLTDNDYQVEPAIGREEEIKNLKLDLLKSKSIILIGEAGIGKTAIVKGLAYDIKTGNVPKQLKNIEIVKIDIHSLISGTRYRGDFEENIKKIIDEVKNKSNVVLYIEEIHTIKGLGDSSTSAFDLLNMLKPYLSEGIIKIIGDTTTAEYDKFIAPDAAFGRRFITEVINEPTKENLKKIILYKIAEFSQQYVLNFSFGEANENLIIDSIIELSDSQKRAYYSTRKNPDFVIDILENIFAISAYNNHNKVTYEDLFAGMEMTKEVSETYKNRIINDLQNLLEIRKKKAKSRVLSFPSKYSLK